MYAITCNILVGISTQTDNGQKSSEEAHKFG